MCAHCEISNYLIEDEDGDYVNDRWETLVDQNSAIIVMGLVPEDIGVEDRIGIWAYDGYGEPTGVFYPTYCPFCGRKIIENE